MRACLITAVLAAGLLMGCDRGTDYSARFIRYEDVKAGPLVAVVSPLAQSDDKQLAYTDLGDLKPGEFVTIRYIGKDFETPQSSPEREIVGRAEKD